MLNKEMKVSIECMTYNHAPYIEDAMNGFCMQQTAFPFVAVIIDDASTDGEPEVIKSYLNDHFDMQHARSWETDDACFIEAQHKENENCTFAVVLLKYNFWQIKKDKTPLIAQWMNSAQYVALCEGDDYWTHPEKLQMQIEMLEEHPECSFSVHDYTIWFQKDERLLNQQLSIFNGNNSPDSIILDYDDILRYNSVYKTLTKTLTCVYRKQCLSMSNFSKYKDSMDMNMFYALLTIGKCILLKKQMGCYRVQGNSVTNGGNWEQHVLKTVLPNQFSIIEVEKTKRARRYVYGWVRPRIFSLIRYHHYSVLTKCIKYLGVRLNTRLFLIDFPKQMIEILKNKINVINQNPATL